MPQTIDRRQLILDRLFTLLSELEIPLQGGGGPKAFTSIPTGNIVRNRNELPADKVPGIILLDGDELRDPAKKMPERGQIENAIPTQVMRMTPEIYIVLDVRGITNPNVGEDLNAARMAILGAILPDQTLQSLVGSNGNIYYDGGITDLARNRTMRGQMGISITFQYPLIGNEVTGLPSP